MKKPNEFRSFWKYNRDNWPIYIPFVMGIAFGIFCITDGERPNLAWTFFGVSGICIMASYIDWRRLG